jgi:hypothetical protein
MVATPAEAMEAGAEVVEAGAVEAGAVVGAAGHR